MRALLLAGIVTVAGGMASPASAQWFAPVYRPPVVMDEMSPREVFHTASRHGFHSLSQPVYGEDTVSLNAMDSRGRRVRLTLDSFSGRLVAVRPLPERPRQQVAQTRAPVPAPAVRPAIPETSSPTRATPDHPTVIRREPMLPPQPQTQGPAGAPRTIPVPEPRAATGPAPRRVDGLPPAVGLDAPPTAARPQPLPPGPPVPVAPLD